MIDFIKELSLFQWVLIAGGALLIFPIIKDFFVDGDDEEDAPNVDYPIKNIENSNALTSITIVATTSLLKLVVTLTLSVGTCIINVL